MNAGKCHERKGQTRADQTARTGRRRVYKGLECSSGYVWYFAKQKWLRWKLFCMVQWRWLTNEGSVGCVLGPRLVCHPNDSSHLLFYCHSWSQFTLLGAELCPWAPRALLASLLWWTFYGQHPWRPHLGLRDTGWLRGVLPVTRGGSGVTGELPVSVGGRRRARTHRWHCGTAGPTTGKNIGKASCCMLSCPPRCDVKSTRCCRNEAF